MMTLRSEGSKVLRLAVHVLIALVGTVSILLMATFFSDTLISTTLRVMDSQLTIDDFRGPDVEGRP